MTEQDCEGRFITDRDLAILDEFSEQKREASKREPRLRLLREVRGAYPVWHSTVAEARIYADFEVRVNRFGTVSVLANDRSWLGVKPHEMGWISREVKAM